MEPLLVAMRNAQDPVYMNTRNLMDDVMPTILLIVGCGVAQFVGGYVCQMCWVLTGENQTKRIREAYVQAVLRQDMGWFDASEDGSLTTRLAQDTQVVQQGISENVGAILQSAAQFAAGFAVAFVQSWRMSLVMLACLPLLAGSGGWMIHSITAHTAASR
ncbi:MAG: ABC transporter type 1, transmembrane domain-containing protein, partial [Olpidium bornovanus]